MGIGDGDDDGGSGRPHVLTQSVQWLVYGFTGTVVLLIAAAVLGLDKGEVVNNLGRHDFARGLITYLFTLTTILIAIILIIAAVLGGGRPDEFAKGKEVLALMLGVFGTIVGFYFGAETSTTPPEAFGVSPLLLSDDAATSGETIGATAFVQGAPGPLNFGFALDESPIQYDSAVPDDGWIRHEITMPEVGEVTMVTITLGVRDMESTTERTAQIAVRPAGG